jgi:hypothetical protein
MRISANWMGRAIAYGLVMILAVPSLAVAAASPQEGTSGQQAQSVPPVPSESQSSGSGAAKVEPKLRTSDAILPDSPSPTQFQSAAQGEPPATSQSAAEQQQEAAQKPVGAAAAPLEKTTGVAASRPAGAVIAPAKQRRSGSILIRVGIVVGAAVAVGTVVALSHGSPSRPN